MITAKAMSPAPSQPIQHLDVILNPRVDFTTSIARPPLCPSEDVQQVLAAGFFWHLGVDQYHHQNGATIPVPHSARATIRNCAKGDYGALSLALVKDG